MLLNRLVPTTEVLAFNFSGHMEADIMINVADRPDFGEHCIYTINLYHSHFQIASTIPIMIFYILWKLGSYSSKGVNHQFHHNMILY